MDAVVAAKPARSVIIVTHDDRGEALRRAVHVARWAMMKGAEPVDVPAPLLTRSGSWSCWLDVVGLVSVGIGSLVML